MYPWGHLAVGYLLYTVLFHLRFRRPPLSGPTVALAIGTQLPDLIDKPLHLWAGIYDGRAIGHSLLTVLPLCLLVLVLAHRSGHIQSATAFGIGVLTHPLADARWALLDGRVVEDAAYLFWPLLPAPTYPEESATDHLLTLTRLLSEVDLSSPAAIVNNTLVFDSLLAVVLLSIWLYDGAPGVGTFRKLVTRAR